MQSIPQGVTQMISSFNDFAPGVPADDATCLHIIEVLKNLDDGEMQGESPYESFSLHTWGGGSCGGGIPFSVNDDTFVVFDMGFDEGEEYPDNRTLQACFRFKADSSMPFIKQDKPVTPDGLRDLIAWAKTVAKDVKERGLCPNCPGKATIRLPTAEYCAQCSLKLALGL